MATWQLQSAKQHFSEIVERARSEGPQTVTKHGRDAVVVIATEEYRRLSGQKPSLVEYIMDGPDFDLIDLDSQRKQPDPPRDVEL